MAIFPGFCGSLPSIGLPRSSASRWRTRFFPMNCCYPLPDFACRGTAVPSSLRLFCSLPSSTPFVAILFQTSRFQLRFQPRFCSTAPSSLRFFLFVAITSFERLIGSFSSHFFSSFSGLGSLELGVGMVNRLTG